MKTIPPETMTFLLELEQQVKESVRRRDDALRIVLSMVGAPPNARIEVQPDRSGVVVWTEPETEQTWADESE